MFAVRPGCCHGRLIRPYLPSTPDDHGHRRRLLRSHQDARRNRALFQSFTGKMSMSMSTLIGPRLQGTYPVELLIADV